MGVRLQDGDDFPYSAQNGFSAEFLSTENTLIVREPGGGVCRDKDGRVKLACTCGMVLTAKPGRDHPSLTRGGSFWTNNSRPILQIPPARDPRLKPRNRCIHDGYASVALVPIRSKDTVVGLIHLNDRRKKRFTLETVELMEGIASSIGSALMRKRLEADVRESEEKYRGVFESGFDPVLFIDGGSGRIESANAAALQMYGYDEGAMLALKAENLGADAERARECLAGVVAGRTKGVVTGFRHKKKDGTEFPVEISASRRVIGGQVKVIAAVHDVTRRMRDAETAARADAKAALLRAREVMIAEMMATVSHEMRTPLSAIKGFAETLRCGGLEDKENRVDFVETIERHAQRLSLLVEDMLLMTDLDSRAKPPAFEAIDLAGFVSECVTSLAPLIKSGGAPLACDVPGGLTVRVDADRMTRVFQNLLDNAFKYNRRNGPVSITARADGAAAVVTVRDAGLGIPEGDLGQVFERFYRSRETKHIHGTGLGLSIVKSIVELHGGRVWAESVIGEGSAFHFSLPLAG